MRNLLLTITFGISIIFSAKPCTTFTINSEGKTYFCNNEDSNRSDTELRIYPAKQGKYGWIYLGYSNNWAQGGVNEKGLCWDWVVSDSKESWEADSNKLTFNGNLSEKMIMECSTVEEAISFYCKYNEASFSVARIMIADKAGNSAIIGWKDGKIDIQRSSEFQVLGWRSQCIESYFANNPVKTNITSLADALNASHQVIRNPTQYSNIFSLNEGKIYLFNKKNYNEYLEINYLQLLKFSQATYKISEFFTNNDIPEVKFLTRPNLTSMKPIEKLSNGIEYKYYESVLKFIPKFNTVTAKTSGVMNNIGLNIPQRETNFAIRFDGYIYIEEEGEYTFYLNSNDGSQLFLNDNLIVANSGEHILCEENGSITLEKGMHKLKVFYFQAGGSYGLEVSYESNKINKTLIPEAILYHKKSNKRASL